MWTRIPLRAELPETLPSGGVTYPAGGLQAYLVASVLRGRLSPREAVAKWSRERDRPTVALPGDSVHNVSTEDAASIVITWVSLAMQMSDPKPFLDPILEWVQSDAVIGAMWRMLYEDCELEDREIKLLRTAAVMMVNGTPIHEVESWFRLNNLDKEPIEHAPELTQSSHREAWCRINVSLYGTMNIGHMDDRSDGALQMQTMGDLLHKVLPESVERIVRGSYPLLPEPSADRSTERRPGTVQASLAHWVTWGSLPLSMAALRWETDWFGPMGTYVPDSVLKDLNAGDLAQSWIKIASVLQNPSRFLAPIHKWIPQKKLGEVMSALFEVSRQKELPTQAELYLVTLVEDAIDVSARMPDGTLRIPSAYYTQAAEKWKGWKKLGKVPEPRGELGDRGADFARTWIRLSMALGMGTNIPSLRNWANGERVTGAAQEFFTSMVTPEMVSAFSARGIQPDVAGKPTEEDHAKIIEDHKKALLDYVNTPEGRKQLSESILRHPSQTKAAAPLNPPTEDETTALALVHGVCGETWTREEAVTAWLRRSTHPRSSPLARTATPRDPEVFTVDMAIAWIDTMAAIVARLTQKGADEKEFKKDSLPFTLAADYWFDPKVMAEAEKVVAARVVDPPSTPRLWDHSRLVATILDIHYRRVTHEDGVKALLSGEYACLPSRGLPRTRTDWLPIARTWMRVTADLRKAGAPESLMEANQSAMDRWVHPMDQALVFSQTHAAKSKPNARSEQAAALVCMVHAANMTVSEAVEEWNRPENQERWKVGSSPMNAREFTPELASTWFCLYDSIVEHSRTLPDGTPRYTGDFISALRDWVTEESTKKGWDLYTQVVKSEGPPAEAGINNPPKAEARIPITANELRTAQARAEWEKSPPPETVMRAALNGMCRLASGEWTESEFMTEWMGSNLPREAGISRKWAEGQVDPTDLASVWIQTARKITDKVPDAVASTLWASMHQWIPEAAINGALKWTHEAHLERWRASQVQENMAQSLVFSLASGACTLREAVRWWKCRHRLGSRVIHRIKVPTVKQWGHKHVRAATKILSDAINDKDFTRQLNEWRDSCGRSETPTFTDILQFVTDSTDNFSSFSSLLPKHGVMVKMGVTALALTATVFRGQVTPEAAADSWMEFLTHGIYRTAPDVHVTPEFLDTGMRVAQKIIDTHGVRAASAYLKSLEIGANNPRLWNQVKEMVYAAEKFESLDEKADRIAPLASTRPATPEEDCALLGIAVLVGIETANMNPSSDLFTKELSPEVLGKKWVEFVREGKPMGMKVHPSMERTIINHNRELLTGETKASVAIEFMGQDWSRFLDRIYYSPTRGDEDDLKFSACIRDAWRQYASMTPDVVFEEGILTGWLPPSWSVTKLSPSLDTKMDAQEPTKAPPEWAWDSTPSLGKKMLGVLKDDAKEIALRTGVKRVRSAAAAQLGAWWARHSNPQRVGESDAVYAERLVAVRDTTRSFLNSDMGEAALTMLLGFVWMTVESEVNPMPVREFGSMVARELRISAGTDILDGVVTEVLNPVVEEFRQAAPAALETMTGVRVGENTQALEEAQEQPLGAVSEPAGERQA